MEDSAFCPDEDNWQDMFEALGNREVQQNIRTRYPDVVHCLLLESSATACDGCPKSPENQSRADRNLDVIEEWSEPIYDGLELIELCKLGLVKSLSELSPEQVTLILAVAPYQRIREQELQAKLIAAKVGEMLFSSTRK